MRDGFSNALRRKLNSHPSPCVPILELVVDQRRDLIDTFTEWGEADALTGFTRRYGEIILTGSDVTVLDQSTGTATTLNNLVPPRGASSLSVAAVQWTDSGAQDREIRAVTARLNPNVSAGTQEVAYWQAEIFRLARVTPDGERPRATVWHLEPLVQPVRVSAGASTADVTFTFGTAATVGLPPSLEGPFGPVGDAPTYPTTVMVVYAYQADGTQAANVAWVSDSGNSSVTVSGHIISRYDLTLPTFGGGGLTFANTGVDTGVPRCSFVSGSYSAQTITFTSNPLDIGASPDSGTELQVVVEGRARGGSIAVEIDDGGGWVAVLDGDVIGVNKSAVGGSDLSGVTRQQSYDIRATLTPSSVGATPILSRIGVREVLVAATVPDGEDIIFGDVSWAVDPQTGTPEIPEIDITLLKSGRRDYRTLVEDLLAHYDLSEITARIWVGDPRDGKVDWGHLDDFIPDDYDAVPGAVVLKCISPLGLLRREIPELTGSTIEPLSYASQTPAALTADLVANQIGVPARWIGPGVGATTPTLTQEIVGPTQGIEELAAAAYIPGWAYGSSQGRLKAFDLFGGESPESSDLSLFEYEETDVQGFSPGYRTRKTSSVARYGWDAETEKFAGSRRATNTTAVNALGRATIDADESVPDIVCRYLESGTDAQAVAERDVEFFGPGMKLVRIRSAKRRPWLEPGDPIVVETDLVVGKHPETGAAIRGPMLVFARVQRNDSLMGDDITGWIRSWEDIIPTTASQVFSGFAYPDIASFDYWIERGADAVQDSDLTNWDLVNTPVVTGGVSDPYGGTNAYTVEDDDTTSSPAVGVEYIKLDLASVPDTGTYFDEVLFVVVFKKNGSPTAPHTFLVYDATDSFYPIVLNVGWPGGGSTPEVTAGAGVAVGQRDLGNGWWEIVGKPIELAGALGIDPANSFQVRIYPCGDNPADGSAVGSVDVYDVSLYNAKAYAQIRLKDGLSARVATSISDYPSESTTNSKTLQVATSAGWVSMTLFDFYPYIGQTLYVTVKAYETSTGTGRANVINAAQSVPRFVDFSLRPGFIE